MSQVPGQISFSINECTKPSLARLLDRHSHEGKGVSQPKPHLDYLAGYLDEIGARSVLEECPYTDKDYLEDYAAYYARCHAQYGRRCARLHFFNCELADHQVIAAAEGELKSVELLQAAYLGFVVLKPLPSTVIGRTCLKTYSSAKGRSFPTIRPHVVHLFGIELTVDSLPFQEQDRDVAACATSALWSVFNATGHLFHHGIPSPAEITNSANEAHRVMSRALPAAPGLTGEQITDAIRSVDLETDFIKANDLDTLRVSAVAYLKHGIPSILLGSLTETRDGMSRILGLHAVALAGFGRSQSSARASTDAPFAATSVDRLYAHDDQVGPFSKLKIAEGANGLVLKSQLRGEDVHFEPLTLIVPLYHKIRLPFETMMKVMVSLNGWFKSALKLANARQLVSLATPIVWDIELADNARYKAEVRVDETLEKKIRGDLVRRDLPRYLWRMRAMSDGRPIFDLLFDATDLLQGSHVTGLAYRPDICAVFASLAATTAFQERNARSGPNRHVDKALEWLIDNLEEFQAASGPGSNQKTVLPSASPA